MSDLSLPITLASSQTWSINGESGGHGLKVDNTVAGASANLHLELKNQAKLLVETDAEVGDVTVSSPEYPEFLFLGSHEVAGALNAIDGNPIHLGAQTQLVALDGSSGPLSAENGSLIQVGDFEAGTLLVEGALTMQSRGLLQSMSASGTVAGKDYSQIKATGSVSLGSALLLTLFDSGCKPLHKGDVDTLNHHRTDHHRYVCRYS